PWVSRFPTSSFLQIPPHDGHPCLRLCLSRYRADLGLAPLRNVRRQAHHTKRTRRPCHGSARFFHPCPVYFLFFNNPETFFLIRPAITAILASSPARDRPKSANSVSPVCGV